MEMERLESPDVITAGFPCQDLSYAGEGAGLSGERSSLIWQARRAIRMVRPKFALLENVAALLNRGMGCVLGMLAQIGYDTEWNCIPSSYVGAWHKRDRVWILAYSMQINVERGIQKPIFEQSYLSRELARGFEKWPGRSNLPAPVFISADDGVSNRVASIEGYGNSVVPQIPELIGYSILEAEKNR